MLSLLLQFFIPTINEPIVDNRPVVVEEIVAENFEEYEVSAYCLSGIMANTHEVHEGAIACPAYLKFGTKIEIEGKEYTCSDRMHLRYRHKKNLDIWMNNCDDAIKFGRKKLFIKIK